LTKDPLPMEIDFILQDTFTLIRPQWKIVTDLSEAGRLFADAVATNYKQSSPEKVIDVDEEAEDSASDDGLDAEDVPEILSAHSSSDEVEVCYTPTLR